MKKLIVLFLLIIPILAHSQVFHNKTRPLRSSEILIIPNTSFAYTTRTIQFLERQGAGNQVLAEEDRILPELYVGGLFVSEGWMGGFHYGVLQGSYMISAGVVLPVTIHRRSKGKRKRKRR